MRFIEKNKIGESIMYEFIDSTKIRLTCNKIKRHISYSDDTLVMYDIEGGPVITKGANISINGIGHQVTDFKIINSENDDIIELMLFTS